MYLEKAKETKNFNGLQGSKTFPKLFFPKLYISNFCTGIAIHYEQIKTFLPLILCVFDLSLSDSIPKEFHFKITDCLIS